MKSFVYKDEKASQISFPLGGIGTGCIGLAGNGRFIDVEINNRPNKGSHGGFTHFAIKAEDNHQVLDARVIQSDLPPSFMGSLDRPRYRGFGFGPDRAALAGLPHFRFSRFKGTFPIAELEFMDPLFPGRIKMLAFNPFIPGNDFDSSLPGAFFEIQITNTSSKELVYSTGLTCSNFYAEKNRQVPVHEVVDLNGFTGLHLRSDGDSNLPEYGDLTIASDGPDSACQQYWFRGMWFDSLTTYWQDFCSPGPLKNRIYGDAATVEERSFIDSAATLVCRFSLKPGESRPIRFVLTWSMPWMNVTWQLTDPNLSAQEIEVIRSATWKNHYASHFSTSADTARYGMEFFPRLLEETRLFRDALFSSSLPDICLEAISANLSVLKSPTCLRLSDGSFYGFEGCHAHEGSCEGTCTHVWSYAYALAFLFPSLERSARSLEYHYSIDIHGGMGFRLQLPLGRRSSFRPCVDGQYGTLLRVYREFLVSGDIDWLRSIWPAIKSTIAYAWSDKNPDGWDRDKDGILEGRQHHTLDVELFGPNAWLSGMYLAGLKSGMELAKVLGDVEAYTEYSQVFECGREKLNQDLFNGSYFIQRINLKDSKILRQFNSGLSLHGQTAWDAYWDSEHEEIKYQAGESCLLDQVLGQWHADLLGLGNIFDPDKTTSALNSIYQNNFVRNMRGHFNPCRVYSLNDESGLIISSHPPGRSRPFIPVPYGQETMTGFEYQAASHMILRGLEKEGLECVRAIRARYDGRKRNPWNEMECGSHYARSLSCYALLLVYSGVKFDMYRKMIGFQPLHPGRQQFFWSLEGGWGTVSFREHWMRIRLLYGKLELQRIRSPWEEVLNVKLDRKALLFEILQGEVVLSQPVTLNPGDSLVVIGNASRNR